MEIVALKQNITSGIKNYPIYIAFIEASKILKISIVPNFDKDDPEESLANNLKNLPVKKWQRPLDTDKRENITNTFNNNGEFMPNPVLLSQNPFHKEPNVQINPKVIGGQTSEMWLIEIPDNEKVLWIIDGQHRINGLGHQDCKQKMNHVPVVLLLNENNSYSPADFAKIFAQVTTTATTLKDLHKEWMEYAFKMSGYRNLQRIESMATVIELCANSDFTEGDQKFSNPFYNEIIFNDQKLEDNMKLNCKVFADLIYENYFSQKPRFHHLQPTLLAPILEKGIYELKKNVINPENSVFFGTINKRHMIMLKSILKGMLSYVLTYCNPMDPATFPSLQKWIEIFQILNINITNWDWSGRTTRSEGWFKKSEQLASVVMIESFKKLKIPDGCIDFESSICLGNNRFLTFEFTGAQFGTIQQIVRSNNRTIINLPGMTNMKIIDKSFNNEHISIVDERSRAVHPEKFIMDYARKNKGKGVFVPVTRETNLKRLATYHSTNRFNLVIISTLYGGQLDNCIIEFSI
jgi:DGQHR domain-containing protein